MEPRSTRDIIIVKLPVVSNTADTPNPLGCYPLKNKIWESSRKDQRKFGPSGVFEPTTSGLDLPVLYRLSYEASTGAGLDNLGSEFAVGIQMI